MKNDLKFSEAIEYHLALQYLDQLLSTYQPRDPRIPITTTYSSAKYQAFGNPLSIIQHYPLDTTKKNILHTIVNNIFSELINHHPHNRGGLIKDIKEYIDESIIRIEDIPWIDEGNYRQCLFVWYKFSQIEISNIDGAFLRPYSVWDSVVHVPKRVYTLFNQNLNYPLKNQKMQSITDTISLIQNTKQEKLKLLSQINDEFKLAESIESFSFLDNTIDKEWATHYLDNIFKNDHLYELDSYIRHPFNSSNVHKDIVILNFDITSRETARGKKEIIKSLKKAWHQRLHRQNLQKKNRKAYNFTLSKDIQQKLDFIKESWEERERERERERLNGQRFDPLSITKNEIVEILINKEFDNLTSRSS